MTRRQRAGFGAGARARGAGALVLLLLAAGCKTTGLPQVSSPFSDPSAAQARAQRDAELSGTDGGGAAATGAPLSVTAEGAAYAAGAPTPAALVADPALTPAPALAEVPAEEVSPARAGGPLIQPATGPLIDDVAVPLGAN